MPRKQTIVPDDRIERLRRDIADAVLNFSAADPGPAQDAAWHRWMACRSELAAVLAERREQAA